MHHRGWSLIELLVGLTLSLAIMWILVHGLMGAQYQLNQAEAWARVGEKARLAQGLLHQALSETQSRSACARSPLQASGRVQNHLNTDPLVPLDTVVRGWDAPGTGSKSEWSRLGSASRQSVNGSRLDWPFAWRDRIDPQSDLLVTYTLEALPDHRVIGWTASEIQLDQGHELEACDLMLLSDCQTTWLFQNSQRLPNGLSGSQTQCRPGNRMVLDQRTAERSLAHIMIDQWHIHLWFVGPDSIGQPTLYKGSFRQGLDQPRFEALITGVETLQLEYWVKDPLLTPQWRDASRVQDWSMVDGVRVGIIIGEPTSNPDRALKERTEPLPLLSSRIGFDAADPAHRMGFTTAVWGLLNQ